MEFVSKRGWFFATIFAVGLSSVLVWFGNSLDPWWPLLWLAPVPVLIVALRGSAWLAGLAIGLAWLIGSFTLWNYFHLIGLQLVAFISIFGTAAAVTAVAGLLFGTLVRKGALWSGLLAFPATIVTAEYLRNLATPHGTAGSLAYSQLRLLPFLQLASITGPWGMSFLLMLFPAGVAIAIHLYDTARKQALRVLSASAGALAIVLILGAARLAIPQEGPAVRVGLIASDQRKNVDIAGAGAEATKLFAQYAAKAQELASRGARVIVLPEKLAAVVPSAATGDGNRTLQQVADETGTTIVAGEVYIEGTSHYNQARVLRPRTRALAYNKHHMLPPFENPLTPGTTELTFAGAAGTYGVEICKDMDFTPLSREYGRAHVGLMLTPAWDFNIDRSWHGHIAIMRAVEDGFSLVRAAKNGYLTVADSRGRVVAESRSDARMPFTTLLASVPARHSATLYILLGDWFAWAACVVLIVCLVRALRLALAGLSVPSVPTRQLRSERPGLQKG
jgi:apolipoprotein N-acyltransferase